MGVQTRALGGRSLARRAGLALAVPALALTLALGGCRAERAQRQRNNGNSGVPGDTEHERDRLVQRHQHERRERDGQ